MPWNPSWTHGPAAGAAYEGGVAYGQAQLNEMLRQEALRRSALSQEYSLATARMSQQSDQYANDAAWRQQMFDYNSGRDLKADARLSEQDAYRKAMDTRNWEHAIAREGIGDQRYDQSMDLAAKIRQEDLARESERWAHGLEREGVMDDRYAQEVARGDRRYDEGIARENEQNALAEEWNNKRFGFQQERAETEDEYRERVRQDNEKQRETLNRIAQQNASMKQNEMISKQLAAQEQQYNKTAGSILKQHVRAYDEAVEPLDRAEHLLTAIAAGVQATDPALQTMVGSYMRKLKDELNNAYADAQGDDTKMDRLGDTYAQLMSSVGPEVLNEYGIKPPRRERTWDEYIHGSLYNSVGGLAARQFLGFGNPKSSDVLPYDQQTAVDMYEDKNMPRLSPYSEITPWDSVNDLSRRARQEVLSDESDPKVQEYSNFLRSLRGVSSNF